MTVIMISAMFENGGNLTHRLFDGHPELFVYPFESQVGTRLVNDHLTTVVPTRYRWPAFPLEGTPEQDYELFEDEELRTYLRVPARSKFQGCGLEMHETDRRRAFLAFMAERPRTRRDLVLAYFDSTFAAWRNRARSGRERGFVGFNPFVVLDAEAFFADFPDGHLVHVIRDPLAAYADTMTRPAPWTPDRYGWTWGLCQQAAAVAAEQRPDRVHLVQLEHLVRDPAGVLRPVLERMGFAWSDSCLTPSFNGRALPSLAPWGVIRSPATAVEARPGAGLDPAVAARLLLLTRPWRDRLYATDAALVPSVSRPF